jgi:hypothetical protein
LNCALHLGPVLFNLLASLECSCKRFDAARRLHFVVGDKNSTTRRLSLLWFRYGKVLLLGKVEDRSLTMMVKKKMMVLKVVDNQKMICKDQRDIEKPFYSRQKSLKTKAF